MIYVDDVVDRYWVACEQPERPPDDECHFHLSCKPCRLAGELWLANNPEHRQAAWLRECFDRDDAHPLPRADR
jgi:hypothetical protein